MRSGGDRFAVFRTDGGPQIGGGHLLRCHTLADELQRTGWSVALATRRETVAHLGEWARWPDVMVAERGADLQPVDLAGRWPEGCDLLVTDGYGFDRSYQRGCRGWARRVMVIDDLADRHYDCDILLDPTVGRSVNDYARLVPDPCVVLAGAAYALVRPRFAELRPAVLKRRHAPLGAPRLLVALGLTENDDAVQRIVESVLSTCPDVAVDVVTGHGHGGIQKGRVRHLGRVTDMAAIMASADLAIGAAGGSAWERCCLGLPTLLIVLADNQQAIADVSARSGAGLSFGSLSTETPERLARALKSLIADETLRRDMVTKAAALCDGQGARRAVRAITLNQPDGEDAGG